MNAIVEGIIQAITGAVKGQEARRTTSAKTTSRPLVLPAVDSKQEPSALALMVVLFAGFLGVANTGHAVTTTALQDTTCAADREGQDLNCTANEFATLDVFEIVSPLPVTCLAGEQITADVRFRLSNSNTRRYDIGFFVGQEGNSPALTAPPPPLGLCSVATFPTSPFPWQDYDGDACGDYAPSGNDTPVVQNVKILCVGDPDTGLVEVPYTLTYWENTQFTCNGPENVTAGTRSKCADGTAIVVTGTEPLVVYGSVTVTKQTEPDRDPDSFSFTANGDVTTCPGSPTPTNCPGKIAPGDESFSLSDGQSKVVKMVVGSTSHVLTITEIYNPGWESTADITCSGGVSVTTDGSTRTILATLNTTSPHATCTITNRRQRDFGDAPASYGDASHVIPASPATYLGTIVPDAEAGSQPTPPGLGDDNTGTDDEEGVLIIAQPGGSIFTPVYVACPAVPQADLCVWLDGANTGTVDGLFDPGERQCVRGTCITSGGSSGFGTPFYWTVPNAAQITTYLRVRVTSPTGGSPDISPIGGLPDGEVEDYQLIILPTRALISRFAVERDLATGLPAVVWDTASEQGTLGFYLERWDAGLEQWLRLNADLLPGLIDAPMGAQYRLIDDGVAEGEPHRYRLIEVEAWGGTNTYGPYEVSVGGVGLRSRARVSLGGRAAAAAASVPAADAPSQGEGTWADWRSLAPGFEGRARQPSAQPRGGHRKHGSPSEVQP